MPQNSTDALADLIAILEHDRRESIGRAWILNLAKKLHAGAAPRSPISK